MFPTSNCLRLCLAAGTLASAMLLQVGAAEAATESVVYSFCSQAECSDGQFPRAGVTNVGGTLYGTTAEGGAYGFGTVFKIDPTTGVETVLHSFCRKSGCNDGRSPNGGLLHVGGTLYGTTEFGGANGSDYGAVFKVAPSSGAERTVYSFCSQPNCTDGYLPESGLINVDGSLYGTTRSGGSGVGTLFKIDPTTATESVVYSFQGVPDGGHPYAGILNVDGILYGTTYFGGAANEGAVFKLDPTTGAETVLHSFCSQTNCEDGQNPFAGLIKVKNSLFGTTYFGGDNGVGTVFKLKLASGTEKMLLSLGGIVGESPQAGLINVNGALRAGSGCLNNSASKISGFLPGWFRWCGALLGCNAGRA
jgi:uncharacterized repeat protein (TIGR03803 family)